MGNSCGGIISYGDGIPFRPSQPCPAYFPQASGEVNVGGEFCGGHRAVVDLYTTSQSIRV